MFTSIKEIGACSHMFHAHMGKTLRQQRKRAVGVAAFPDHWHLSRIAEIENANCHHLPFGVESYYITAKEWSVHVYARKKK
jgi:hypothetical protein